MKLSDVNVGATLVADGGFTCLSHKQECLVQGDENGLYIMCGINGEDKHYLDGQEDEDGNLVGLTLKQE